MFGVSEHRFFYFLPLFRNRLCGAGLVVTSSENKCYLGSCWRLPLACPVATSRGDCTLALSAGGFCPLLGPALFGVVTSALPSPFTSPTATCTLFEPAPWGAAVLAPLAVARSQLAALGFAPLPLAT